MANIKQVQLFFVCSAIAPKYRKRKWIFGIIGVMAKALYGYWSGHPCLEGEADPRDVNN